MEILVGSLGDLLAGRQTDTDAAIQAAGAAFDQWWAVRNVGAYPGAYDGHRSRTGPANGQRPQPRQDPAVDAEANLRLAARRVLGFADNQSLTESMVKERRRMLAKKHHPDRGGSVAMMARVNDAADVLLASL